MIYRVVWTADAELQLIQIWDQTDDRGQLASIASDLESKLAVGPYTAGESRPEGWRIAFHKPLAVMFRAYPEEATVRVHAVWTF